MSKSKSKAADVKAKAKYHKQHPVYFVRLDSETAKKFDRVAKKSKMTGVQLMRALAESVAAQ